MLSDPQWSFCHFACKEIGRFSPYIWSDKKSPGALVAPQDREHQLRMGPED